MEKNKFKTKKNLMNDIYTVKFMFITQSIEEFTEEHEGEK